MQIKLPEGIIYNLDNNLSNEEKLNKVNEIINNHNDYFNDKFETSKVRTILDLLYNYLYKDSAIAERGKEYGLLNQGQLKRRREKEISVEDFEPNTLSEVNNRATKKEKGKKAIDKYKKSKIHKLTTLRIPIEKRKNGIVEDESKIHTHIFTIENGQISYKNLRYKQINIDCFTDEDSTLPYIPNNIHGKWLTVYGEENEQPFFFLDNKKLVIKGDYKWDKILFYDVNGKYLFFNPEIEQVKDFSKKSLTSK